MVLWTLDVGRKTNDRLERRILLVRWNLDVCAGIRRADVYECRVGKAGSTVDVDRIGDITTAVRVDVAKGAQALGDRSPGAWRGCRRRRRSRRCGLRTALGRWERWFGRVPATGIECDRDNERGYERRAHGESDPFTGARKVVNQAALPDGDADHTRDGCREKRND